jgi:hypothetical protein
MGRDTFIGAKLNEIESRLEQKKKDVSEMIVWGRNFKMSPAIGPPYPNPMQFIGKIRRREQGEGRNSRREVVQDNVYGDMCYVECVMIHLGLCANPIFQDNYNPTHLNSTK